MIDVSIIEVGPRDGLQNESRTIPTEAKIKLINDLSKTGLMTIEVTSFVSKLKVPQLADAQTVLTQIEKVPRVNYPVLVPNQKGFEDATAAGANMIHVFTSASESFNQNNIDCSVSESLERFKPIFKAAKEKAFTIKAYLSCCLGCPYEGNIPFEKTTALATKLIEMGAHAISIGDTIGVGTPKQVKALLKSLKTMIPSEKIGMHFHDTYGQAIANVYASLEEDIHTFDSALAGLGGCPYAKGATGNVATEEVIYLMHGLGLRTGVDLNKLCEISNAFCQAQQLKNQSRVSQAMSRRR